MAVIATPTLEVLEAAEQKAHDAWIAEGNTEADWHNYLGYEAKREALSQAGVKANEYSVHSPGALAATIA